GAQAGEARPMAQTARTAFISLDVEMPGMPGLEVARLVLARRERPAVVFVTAHERYAADAFAVEAFDYLVKPVEAERLARLVERLAQAGREARPPVEKIPVVGAGAPNALLAHHDGHCVGADSDYTPVHPPARTPPPPPPPPQ